MTTYIANWSSNDGVNPDEGVTGKAPISVLPATTDTTSTSVTLTGRGLSNYGEIQQENFIRLMENFASATPPPAPTVGQLWFNTEENIMYVCVDVAVNVVAASEPRYFPDGTGVWAQNWPTPEVLASREEYNRLAERLNKIVGAPSTDGTNPDPADNEYGWGQFQDVPDITVDATPPFSTYSTGVNGLVPIFNNNNEAQYPGGAAFARPFDNSAWCELVCALYKAARAVYASITGNMPRQGFIRDGRGSSAISDALTKSITFPTVVFPDSGGGNGVAPASFNWLEPNWDGKGIALKLEDWDKLNVALDILEAGRFIFPVAFTNELQVLGTDTLTTWTPTGANTKLDHTFTVTFASESAARAFFNTGGYFLFNMSSGDDNIYTGANQSWKDFLAGEVDGLVFDYRGVGFKQAPPSPYVNYDLGTAPADGHGFYDLLSYFNAADYALKKIFTNSRAIGSAYASSTGVEISAKIDAISPTLTMTVVVSFLEDDNSEVIGSIVGDQPALVSTLTSVKHNHVNMNAPVISHPTATDTGIV